MVTSPSTLMRTNEILNPRNRNQPLPTRGDNEKITKRFRSEAYEPHENNISSESLAVIYQEPDLIVSNLVLPENPLSGTTIPITWTIQNPGNRATRETHWYERIYLSRDPSLDFQDLFIGEFNSHGSLAAGGSYTRTEQISLPDGIKGEFYLIAFVDADLVERNVGNVNSVSGSASIVYGSGQLVPEFQDEGNNVTAQPFTITLQPFPDLQVTQIIMPERTFVGQDFDISYTVTNLGEGDTTEEETSWQDLIYLSRDEFLDRNSDYFLTYLNHRGGLKAGESYTANATITPPSWLQGPFYVFVLTDPPTYDIDRDIFTGKVFEGTVEGNNASPSPEPIIIELPPPADLQVDRITIPSEGTSGEAITIEWTVSNYGEYSATGYWEDGVYLSEDAILDIGDVFLGRSLFVGTIAPNESYTNNLTANLPPLAPGDYRVIVRPDLRNQVYEGTNESNNPTASPNTITTTVQDLQLNTPQEISLDSGAERLYKIVVAEGETLQIDLDSQQENSANELFVRHNAVPTTTVHDFAYSGPLNPDQTVIVPDTEPGTYYILVRSFSGPKNETVVLNAHVLPFGITDVTSDRGGDSKYVTLDIIGAQFHHDAVPKLIRPGIAEFEPVNWEVIDSTQIRAIFDLTDATHGLYDVKVVNPDAEAVLPYRYLVERWIEPDVTIGLGGPRILGIGETGTYGISVASLTNIDTPYVYFQFGVPELGNNEKFYSFIPRYASEAAGLEELPYLELTSNLRGAPEGGDLGDVPWASLVPDINTGEHILAPGYILDLPIVGRRLTP